MSAEAECSWIRTFRSIGDILVVHVDLAPRGDQVREAAEWLDQEEDERWRRYRFDRPQREFALCRAALRVVLCSRLGCENSQLSVGVSGYGKPFALVNGLPAPVSFNVSHSGNHGLIAVTGGRRLGVDVEERVLRRDIDGICSTVFGPNEQAEIASAHEPRRTRLFYRLWTHKEAIIKALGTGFYLDLTRFEIPSDVLRGARKSIFRFPWASSVSWALENLGTAEFAAAIAYETQPD